MKSCTFFGHRQVYDNIDEILKSVLTELIEKGVNVFYVGSQGAFDSIVLRILKLLKVKFPDILYYVVLAYIPMEKSKYCIDCTENTIYPDGLENVPQKYAIVERNKWMIEKADYVVVYVKHTFSNAEKFRLLSEKKGKTVINISDC